MSLVLIFQLKAIHLIAQAICQTAQFVGCAGQFFALRAVGLCSCTDLGDGLADLVEGLGLFLAGSGNFAYQVFDLDYIFTISFKD